MSNSLKSRIKKAKSDRLDVNKHKKQDFNSVSTPQSNGANIDGDVLKLWIDSASNLRNSINKIDHDVSSLNSDKERFEKLEKDIEKLDKNIQQLTTQIIGPEIIQNIINNTLEEYADNSEDETKSRSSAILKWEDEVDESILNFKQEFEKLFKINHELESKIAEISKSENLREDLFNELQEKLREELNVKLREELREELRKELREELSIELSAMLRKELHEDLRQDLSLALREEFHEKLNVEIKNTIEDFNKKIENLSSLLHDSISSFDVSLAEENVRVDSVFKNINERIEKSFGDVEKSFGDIEKKYENVQLEVGNAIKKCNDTVLAVENDKILFKNIVENMERKLQNISYDLDYKCNKMYKNDFDIILEKYILEITHLRVICDTYKVTQKENNVMKLLSNVMKRLEKIEKIT